MQSAVVPVFRGRTSEDVRGGDPGHRGVAARYRAFAAKACDLDDGAATERLIDGMLSAGRPVKTR